MLTMLKAAGCGRGVLLRAQRPACLSARGIIPVLFLEGAPGPLIGMRLASHRFEFNFGPPNDAVAVQILLRARGCIALSAPADNLIAAGPCHFGDADDGSRSRAKHTRQDPPWRSQTGSKGGSSARGRIASRAPRQHPGGPFWACHADDLAFKFAKTQTHTPTMRASAGLPESFGCDRLNCLVVGNPNLVARKRPSQPEADPVSSSTERLNGVLRARVTSTRGDIPDSRKNGYLILSGDYLGDSRPSSGALTYQPLSHKSTVISGYHFLSTPIDAQPSPPVHIRRGPKTQIPILCTESATPVLPRVPA